jgi:16S rRNA (cytosine967-C5)-methyltransferase
MKRKFDWVLVDAPCSGLNFYINYKGTGTLRRNPDIKLKFSHTRL